MTLTEGLVAIPGILALLGVAVAWGTLRQKVKTLEDQMQHLSLLSESVARIDERTGSATSKLDKIDTRIDAFLSVLLGEARSYRETHPVGAGRRD